MVSGFLGFHLNQIRRADFIRIQVGLSASIILNRGIQSYQLICFKDYSFRFSFTLDRLVRLKKLLIRW
ncbi:hypothetical protein ACOSQ4_030041 [Xanthoceras sorbifolium]